MSEAFEWEGWEIETRRGRRGSVGGRASDPGGEQCCRGPSTPQPARQTAARKKKPAALVGMTALGVAIRRWKGSPKTQVPKIGTWGTRRGRRNGFDRQVALV